MHAVVASRTRGTTWLAVVVGLALAYALLWGGGLAWSHRSPPLDTAEQFAWSFALQGGYPKHPPLPTWIMHALISVFGASVAMPFFATFACIAIALGLTWRLGCEFMSPQHSLLALALTALVGYHGFNADAFNHNVVLLPFQAAMTLFFYLAVRRGDWHLWGLAGLFAGLAMLVKYVAVFPIAALLLYLLVDRDLRVRRTVLGVLLAGGVAALVWAPHALWLRAHDFLPLQYMRSVTEPAEGVAEMVSSVARFFIMQFVRLLPLLLVLGWLLLHGRRRAAPAGLPMARGDRLFLWVAGVGPLALLLLYALPTRTPLEARWGSTLFLLAGWLALDLVAHRPLPPGRVAWRSVVLVHVAIWAMTALVTPRLGEAMELRGRARFPGAELATLAQGTWQARTGRPLRIIIADVWLAGNVIAHSAPVAVMIDGELEWSPWLTREDVERCGALVLQNRSIPEGPPPATEDWMAQASEHGLWEIPWNRRHPRGEPERIQWSILPPAPGAGCPL